MCRADWLVGAIAANEAGLCGEFPSANVRSRFLHDFLRLVEPLRITGGHLDLVVLQIVENQAHRVPFEYLFCRKRIKTELQSFFGIRILFWLARFVIDDFSIVPTEGIHLV